MTNHLKTILMTLGLALINCCAASAQSIPKFCVIKNLETGKWLTCENGEQDQSWIGSTPTKNMATRWQFIGTQDKAIFKVLKKNLYLSYDGTTGAGQLFDHYREADFKPQKNGPNNSWTLYNNRWNCNLWMKGNHPYVSGQETGRLANWVLEDVPPVPGLFTIKNLETGKWLTGEGGEKATNWIGSTSDKKTATKWELDGTQDQATFKVVGKNLYLSYDGESGAGQFYDHSREADFKLQQNGQNFSWTLYNNRWTRNLWMNGSNPYVSANETGKLANWLLEEVPTVSTINGIYGLGALPVDRVVFPGTHNSAAGYRGLLYDWGNAALISGHYRNQDKSFTEQLDLGIRYFDIDTMYCNAGTTGWWAPDGAWMGHGRGYAGPVQDLIDQVDSWLLRNPDEFVVIEFNSDVYKSEDWADDIAKSIIQIVNSKWGSGGSSSIRMCKKSGSNWPTMDTLIDEKRQVLVLMHRYLAKHVSTMDGIHKTSYVSGEADIFVENAYSGSPITVDEGAKQNTKAAADKCNSDADFVRMGCFGSYGLYIPEMAGYFDNHIKYGANLANSYRMARPTARVANFIMIDYVGSRDGAGENNIFDVCRRLNLANLTYFRANPNK